MKKIQLFLYVIVLLIYIPAFSQVGIGTATPDASAKLDIISTTQGLLPPRMTTTQRDAIVSPATGLVIFNTTTNSLEYKSSSVWVMLTPTSMGTIGAPTTNGATITSGVLSLSPANATNGGILTSGTQTIGGPKTFNADIHTHGLTIGLGSGNIGTNTAIGTQSLNTNTSGAYNTALGSSALQLNTLGNNNTASGYQTLYTNTTGNNNTANGHNSLLANTGSFNTALGSSSLTNNTSGINNTASGYQTLASNTTGDNNTATGFQSMGTNGIGASNTANGYQSLALNTNGANNTAIGNQALLSNTTGNNNTAIGNLALGTNTTGTNNTAIGYGADIASAALTNATAIGNAAIVSTSNTVQLGNTSITSINTSAKYTGSGFATPTGTNAQYLMADGTTSTASAIVIPDALPTIQIGTQKWMEKNLNTAFYRNGDSIHYVSDATEWAGLTTGAWCYYNNDPANGEIYGKLYNWYAVNDPRGLAPTGWHVPTEVEWTTLTTTLGGGSLAGGKMKVAGTTRWTAPNTGATNSSGFAGLPGGTRDGNGSFGFIGGNGFWWSSTENDATVAWYRYLYYNWSDVYNDLSVKSGGFSVRCLRD